MRKRWMKWLIPGTIFLALLFLGVALSSTPWAQITEKASTGSDWSRLRDCPDGIEGKKQARVVLQTIDATLHKWEEYDLDEAGAFCIILRKPENKKLTAEQAGILLQESRRWREQAPASNRQEILDPRDPRLNLPPAKPGAPYTPGREMQNPTAPEPDKPAAPAARSEPSSRAPALQPESEENPIGPDTRERVTITTSYPWKTIGFIGNSYYWGNRYRGTGFIVTPYVILTAGHMVYNLYEGGYATTLDFAPGQRQSSAGGSVIRPYGTFEAYSWETNDNYVDALENDPDAQFNYDYAAAFFLDSFADYGLGTYMPLVFNVAPSGLINLAGYPREVRGEFNSLGMWFSDGDILGVFPRMITYDADTSGGTSGSPIWQYWPDTGYRRVIALHAMGSNSGNGGPRLVSQNMALIEDWMSWEPGGWNGGGGGGGCFIATVAFGSYLDPHVQILRLFRDRVLLKNDLGHALVGWYYRLSPAAAEMMQASRLLRTVTRLALTPVVFGLRYPLILVIVGWVGLTGMGIVFLVRRP